MTVNNQRNDINKSETTSRFLKKINHTKMKRILFTLSIVLISLQFSFAQRKPVAVIFDSDMGPDYDDVGAIAILHALSDSGYAKILATVSSTKYEGVSGVLNAFNTYFNRPELPVGVPKGKALELKDWQFWTDTVLARYPHKIKKNAEAPDAVDVYRKILASQPDHSVTIITVGFLTNLANLLESKADRFSPLAGKELIGMKVKQLVSMAGGFPEGREFNLSILGGNDGPQVMPPAEILFVDYPNGKHKIVGYNAKWTEDSFEYNHTPRTFNYKKSDEELLSRLKIMALQCWNGFELKGYVRVDFRVDREGIPYVLEINGNPCISPESGFVAATKKAGLKFPRVIERIIEDALSN